MSTLPPTPAVPPLVQTVWWLTRPINLMESCRRRVGDQFSVRFLGFERPMVMLSDPEAIRALYMEHSHGLPPGRTLTLMPILGPRSVLLLEGSEHLARRRLMLPAFHGERMRSYEGIVRDAAERQIASWPLEQPLALHPYMQALTLDVILRAVFGVSDAERGRRLREVTLEIDRLLLGEIAERRAEGRFEEREDILSLLMGARFEDDGQMSDRELRDQLLTLLLAGHETTATALAWTFDLLLRHPATLARLTAEVDEGSQDEYLRAVIAESLRLRPVVPLAGRRLATELRTGEWTLPAGTDVTPAIWLTHTRADLYPEPYSFRPERFLEGAPTTYGWIPFGGGIRRCLGASFAEFEMRVVLQTVLRERELEAVGSRPERMARRNVTLSPQHGTRVRVKRRVARPAPAAQPLVA